jgi:hypothetical protein
MINILKDIAILPGGSIFIGDFWHIFPSVNNKSIQENSNDEEHANKHL